MYFTIDLIAASKFLLIHNTTIINNSNNYKKNKKTLPDLMAVSSFLLTYNTTINNNNNNNNNTNENNDKNKNIFCDRPDRREQFPLDLLLRQALASKLAHSLTEPGQDFLSGSFPF